MKNKYILDSSFISSFIVIDDVNHKKAVRIYDELPSEVSFYLPATVSLEIYLGFTRLGMNMFDKISSFLNDINSNVIYIDRQFMSGYVDFIQSRKITLTAIDASILYCSYIKKADLLTFDKKLIDNYKRIN